MNKTKTYFQKHFSWASEFTENPHMEVPKPLTFEVKEFTEFIGKPVSELKAHLEANYAERLPDLSLMERFEKLLPKERYVWYYFFGSTVRSGRWYVPDSRWDGVEWRRDADWLGGTWDARCRVVLLGTSSSPLASRASSSLALELEKAITVCKKAGLTVTKTY